MTEFCKQVAPQLIYAKQNLIEIPDDKYDE